MGPVKAASMLQRLTWNSCRLPYSCYCYHRAEAKISGNGHCDLPACLLGRYNADTCTGERYRYSYTGWQHSNLVRSAGAWKVSSWRKHLVPELPGICLLGSARGNGRSSYQTSCLGIEKGALSCRYRHWLYITRITLEHSVPCNQTVVDKLICVNRWRFWLPDGQFRDCWQPNC